MASTLGEQPGGMVGYRMRLDTRVGPRTRIEVVTEGILTRQLQRDPALDGIGLVIFDEFHERSLQADLGLAFVLDAQRHVAPDLRVLVMSATLDGAALARLLENAPVVTALSLSYPVETRYAERTTTEFTDRQATTAIRRALRDNEGDILVFLPGAGEIRRVERALSDGNLGRHIHIRPLYGDLNREAQDLAIRPAIAGQRKVVLATNIAETSLTIEGIRVVIDGGLERRAHFDPRSGMSRLETVRISQASADQRRGRAGRLAPGVCYRLWTAAEHRALLPYTPPEIVTADLAPLALELAGWGARDPGALTWMTPPAGPLAQARALLKSLGALDGDGKITSHGRDMQGLATHPRLAHLLLGAKAAGVGATACALAALLGERDLLRGRPGDRDADLRTRLEVLARDPGVAGRDDVDQTTLRQIHRSADAYARQLGLANTAPTIDPEEVGWLLALAYPDRIARAREPGSGRYPDVSDAALLATLESWLAPWLDGVSRATHLARMDLAGALRTLLTWPRQQRLDELAPTHLTVPSGSNIAIDYLDGPVPSLSVRLQEVFGLTATPRVGGGRVPVLLNR